MKYLSEYWTDALFYFSKLANAPLTKPDWVSVNLTLKCNLKCTMCRACYHIENELTTDEIKSIIDQTHAWGVKVFNPLGGEPLMRKDIIEILRHAANKDFKITVTTNGTLINEPMAAELAKLNKVSLNFSIDGLEKTHDAIRGKGSFQKTISGIKLIKKYEQANSIYPKYMTVNCIIHNKNLNELIKLIEMAKSLGMNRIQFLHLFNFDDKSSKSDKNDMWIPSKRQGELDKAMDKLMEYIRNDKSGFDYSNSIGDLEMIRDYYKGNVQDCKSKCYNGLKEFYINADGNSMMCDGNLNFVADSFGNVRERSLKELWRSKKARQMRKKVNQCKRVCVQNCYLRQDSDSIIRIIMEGSKAALARITNIGKGKNAKQFI